MDNLANSKIKITKNAITHTRLYHSYIKPIIPREIMNPKPISTLDIETVKYNSEQIPIIITLAWFENNEIKSKLFIIDYELFVINPEKSIENLFHELYIFLKIILNSGLDKKLNQD